MASDGTNLVNLTAADVRGNSIPAWSTDGRWIAFLAENITGVNYYIWVMEANGAKPIKLTSEGNHIYGEITWSPDSLNLAFINIVVDPNIQSYEIWHHLQSHFHFTTMAS